MYIFCLIALSFFAVIGLATFISSLIRGCNDDAGEMALTLKALKASDAEARVRQAVRICEEIRCSRLVCECRDEEAEAVCRTLQRKHGIIIIT